MGLLKSLAFLELAFLSTLTRANSFSPALPLNNQEGKVFCKCKLLMLMLIAKNLCFFPFSIKTSKFSASCNNINNLYVKLCVPDVVKNLKVKVFNLTSRTNETRHIEWHETCKCKCKVNSSVCIINNAKMMINADVNVEN